MWRPISPRLHGIIDYGLLMMWAGVPHVMGLSPRVRNVFTAMGTAQVALNAVTDQPYAVRRIVPFRVHGLVEKYASPLYVVLPLMAGAWGDRRSRAYFLGAGAALVINFNLTDWGAGAGRFPGQKEPLHFCGPALLKGATREIKQ